MKNFIKKGDTITVVAPYALTGGQGCLVGTLFGLAQFAAAISTEVELVMTGEADVTALSTDTFAQGALVYWDNVNRRCTSTSAGNRIIGSATVAKTSGQTSVNVRLDGVSR